MNMPVKLAGMLFLVAGSLSAQQRTLTLEEAISIGFENSKSLHSSRMKAEYADAKSGETSAGLYPSLKAQLNYLNLSDIPPSSIELPANSFGPGFPPRNATVTIAPVILNNYTAKATFQQPIFTGWKLQGAVDNAEYTANAAHNDFENDRAGLLLNIKAAYWNVYRALEVKRLTEENVEQMSQHLDDIQNMLRQGMATTNEVLKTKVQLSNARVSLSDAENNVKIAVISLNFLIGLPLNTDITPGSTLSSTTKVFPSFDQLLSLAIGRRPDIQGMEWRIKAAEAGIRSAEGGWLPQLYLTGNYYYSQPNQRIFPAVDQFKDTWDVGLNLQFDIWNNLTTLRQTSEAKAQYEQAKDGLAVLKDGITLEVTQSYLNFRQAKEKIDLARLSVEQAEENLRVTHEKFKAGLTTNSELLDAEVARHQAQLQLVQSQVDSELSEAMLEKAIGEGNQ